MPEQLGFASLALLAHALNYGVSWREILGSALIAFAACFGKTAAMTNVLPIAVLLFAVGAIHNWRYLSRNLGYLLFFSSFLALAFVIHFKWGLRVVSVSRILPELGPMFDRASRILVSLLGILVLPYDLRFYYDVYQLGDWHWAVSFAVVILVLVSLYVMAKKTVTLGVWSCPCNLAVADLPAVCAIHDLVFG